MSTDAASLILKIDSTQVAKGISDLDKLTAAGGRAEGATDRLAVSSKAAGAAATEMAARAQMASRSAIGFAGGASTVAKTTGLAAYQAQNLAFQLNDVATGLASGQAPMRVLAQQGGQFVQIMQQSGLGAKGFARALLEMVGILKVTKDAELAAEATAAAANAASLKAVVDRTSAAIASADVEVALASAQLRTATTSDATAAAQSRLANAHRVVAAAAADATIAETALADANASAGIAAQASNSATIVGVGRVGVALGVTAVAAGILAAAFADVKREAGDGNWQQMAKNAGLTRDEMKKLTDTTVTWGDVFASTMDVILERGGVTAEGVKSAWEVALSTVMDFGKFSIAVLIAGFGGLVKFVASAANDIGLLIGKGIALGVNAALGFVEKLINGIIDGVNRVSGLFKAMGIDIGSPGHVDLGRIEARGAFSNPLADANAQFHQTFNDVMGGFNSISQRASNRRDNRVGQQINEIVADRKAKAGGGGRSANDNAAKALDDQTKAYEQALKAGQAFQAQLEKETDSIGQDAIAQKRMEVATQAAALRKAAATAPTKVLKDALNQEADAVLAAGAAWEKVTKENAAADYIKNTVEPLERQVSLLGLSAEAQARANLEAEKGAVIAKYGADAWARYYAAQSAIITDQFKVKNPLQEWLESVPHTAADVTKALQQIEVKGLDGLSTAITDVITGTKSLGAAFSDLARSVIADIIQMTIRMLIFRAISGIFGGASGGAAGAVTNISGLGAAPANFVGPRASGGPVQAGMAYLVGEKRPELFVPDSNGTILPSVPGMGRAANNNVTGPIEIRLFVDTSENLDDKIDAKVIAGSQKAVEISVEHTNKTVGNLVRPRLMGGQ